jgi:uncharacterized protein YjiS (DUF1127 family)
MPAFMPTLSSLVRAVRNRREIIILSQLDDRLLRDIGLQRADIRTALAQPLLRDPSTVLKELCCQGRNLIKRLQDAIAPEPAVCC